MDQIFGDFELIIVDDGSTDNTREVVAHFSDPRIKYYYKENQERSAARNFGIRKASGQYICFLDSDDVYLNYHLQTFYNVIHKLICSDFLFTEVAEFREDNLLKYNYVEIPKISYLSQLEAFRYGLLFPVVCMRWCVNKKLFEKEQFNETYNIGEDMDLFSRLLKHTKEIIHIKNVTVLLTQHEGRSVNKGIPYFKNVEVINHIFNTHPMARDMRQIKNTLLHGNYMAISRIMTRSKNKKEALKYLLKCFALRPFENFIEKLYLLITNFSI